ncbi:RNA-directed DNA polymerase, eukaryota, reverse transcriptase zinc-binding domain protein [Tanacetum coccineum]
MSEEEAEAEAKESDRIQSTKLRLHKRDTREMGKLDFARVLVEVTANDELPHTLEISYPLIGDKPARIGKLDVKYQWQHPLCTYCKKFGHSTFACKFGPRSDDDLAANVLKDVNANNFATSKSNVIDGDDDGVGTKILSAIKWCRGKLVAGSQSAFIPNRQISDYIILFQELLRNYHRDRGPAKVAFKINSHKAYDSVKWGFLRQCLVHFGFPVCMITWIMNCLSSPSFTISINGDHQGYFKGMCGLRQSDPLSPYLFTFVIEVFSLMLKRKIDEDGHFKFYWRCDKLLRSLVGSLVQGSAKVKWNDVCHLKIQGGLGIKSLHMLTDRRSNPRNLWDVPELKYVFWGWKKILQCRTGLSLDCKVADLVCHGEWSWLMIWINKILPTGNLIEIDEMEELIMEEHTTDTISSSAEMILKSAIALKFVNVTLHDGIYFEGKCLKYMTYGVLQRETLKDENLDNYRNFYFPSIKYLDRFKQRVNGGSSKSTAIPRCEGLAMKGLAKCEFYTLYLQKALGFFQFYKRKKSLLLGKKPLAVEKGRFLACEQKKDIPCKWKSFHLELLSSYPDGNHIPCRCLLEKLGKQRPRKHAQARLHAKGQGPTPVSLVVPEGKGVSSSASVEVASMQMVAPAHVENSVVGAACGVMDQMASACCEANKLLAMVFQPAEVLGLVDISSCIRFWGIDSGYDTVSGVLTMDQ